MSLGILLTVWSWYQVSWSYIMMDILQGMAPCQRTDEQGLRALLQALAKHDGRAYMLDTLAKMACTAGLWSFLIGGMVVFPTIFLSLAYVLGK